MGTGIDTLFLVFVLFFLEPFLGRFEAVDARWGEFAVRVRANTYCWWDTGNYCILPDRKMTLGRGESID